jgi:Circularly permutated YpsA SLOG family
MVRFFHYIVSSLPIVAKKEILTSKLLKVISGGQTGVDRGALDAALALQVECGGWCPAGRLAEDGTIPQRYPVMELAYAGYAERTARNVADSDGSLVISKGEPIGGTRETVDRCIEMEKPYIIVDPELVDIDKAIGLALAFISDLSFRVAQTTRNLSSVRKRTEQLGGPSHSLGMTIVLNVAGPRASQWPEGHKTARQIVSGILRRLVDRTTPVNTVRDSPRGDP